MRTTFGGHVVDLRTAKMLAEQGRLVRKKYPHVTIRLTQGCYNRGGVAASAGTHDGGGVRDIDVDGLSRTEILEVVRCGRIVGTADWWRREPEWHGGQHIHGVAVGCPDLSPAAAAQVISLRHGGNGLANHLPDRHADMRLPITTWEAYNRKKRAKAAAALAAVAAAALAGTHAVPAPAKPKPAVVKVAPHPKPKPHPAKVTALSKAVRPGAHAPQVRDVRAVLVKDGYGPIGEKPADWYGPVTRASVHHFFATHPEFGPGDALGPRGWRWLQLKAGRKP